MIKENGLCRIIKVIQSRKNADKSKSYVASLLQGSEEQILKKLTEETTELILAVNSQQASEMVHEVSPLFQRQFLDLEK